MCLTCQAYWARVGVTNWTWRLSNDGWTLVDSGCQLAYLHCWQLEQHTDKGSRLSPVAKETTRKNNKPFLTTSSLSDSKHRSNLRGSDGDDIHLAWACGRAERVGRWRCDSIEQHRKSKSSASSRENGLNVRRVAFTSPHSYQCGIETVVYSIKKMFTRYSSMCSAFLALKLRHPPATPTIFWVIFTIYLFFPPELSSHDDDVKMWKFVETFPFRLELCVFCQWRKKSAGAQNSRPSEKKSLKIHHVDFFFLVRVNIKKKHNVYRILIVKKKKRSRSLAHNALHTSYQ